MRLSNSIRFWFSLLMIFGLVNTAFAQLPNPYFPNQFQYVFVDGGGENSSGTGHTIALSCDGTVWTWGKNSAGQLGTGTNIPFSDTAVQVVGVGGVGFLEDVIEVAAGGNHSLALLDNGTVVAWGLDDGGQLGNGLPEANSNVPVVVSGLSNVIDIEAGEGHSVALLANGTVFAWGDNFDGQLGINCNGNPDRATPDQMVDSVSATCGAGPYIQNVTKIAANGNNTFMLMSDGTIRSTGKNSFGQLGNSGNAKRRGPVGVVNINTAVAIAAGQNHALALLSDGSVRAWGNNTRGQLGDGTTSDDNEPVTTIGLPNNVVALAAGDQHSKAMLSDGAIIAWGDDGFLQLGDGPANDGGFVNSPFVSVVGLTGDAFAVSSGINHNQGLLMDNTVMSWGRDASGELGDDAPLANSNVAVTVIGFDLGFLQAEAGPDTFYCSGDSVQIGVAPEPGYCYVWTPTIGLSDPNISNPFVNLNSNSTTNIEYVVEVQLCSGSITPCISTDTVRVTIRPETEASFDDNAPRCQGEAVDFLNTGTTGGGVNYFWDFGPGATPATSTLENPTGVIYSTPGLKLVTFAVEDLVCGNVDTVRKGIVINEEPTAAFTFTPPTCNDDEVNFTNTGSTGANWTYLWDFGAGATPQTSLAEDPQAVTYSTPGTKIIRLVVSDGNCSDAFTDTLVVPQIPVADFTSSAPKCTGSAVDFINTGTAGATYSWNFGAGATPTTAAVENPTGIVYSSVGTKLVTLVTTLGACSDTSVQTININLTPSVSFTSTAPQCVGPEVDFTNTGTSGLGWTFEWDFGSNAYPPISFTDNPNGVSYGAGGTKIVTLTISDANCSATATNTITINPKPSVDFVANTPRCTGASVDFVNLGSAGTYTWDFGAGATPATSTVFNPSGIVYSTAGTKSVTLTTTLGGCTDSKSKTIQIKQTPAVSFTTTAPQCADAPVDFTNTGTSGSGWTYVWDFGANSLPGISTTENPTGVTYSQGGSKTVTLTVTDAYCTASTTNTITIDTKPVADFATDAPKCTGDTVAFTNTGTVGATYSWDFGAGASPATASVENPSGVIYSTSGTNTITLITTTGNCSDTSIQTVNIGLTPTVGFTSIAPQCAEAPVDFTNTGTSGLGWTFSWDLGNDAQPATSTAESPQGIRYTKGGSQVVTFTISNANCAASVVDTIMIEEKPVASFATNAPQCTGDSVNFINTGTTGGLYQWSFGLDATPINAFVENPGGVIYTSAAVEGVTLITTLGNCTDTMVQIIDINLTPMVAFTSTAPQCAGTAVDFTNTGDTGPNWSYFWDLGANATPGVSTAENPEGVVYEVGGTKTVTLTISDEFCTNTASATIDIDEQPVADAGADTTICANRCTEIGTLSVPGSSYSWFPTATLDNPNVATPIACPTAAINEYFVTVTGSNGCVKQDSITVTMLPPAVADAGDDVEICLNDTVQIGAALVEGQTYSWTPVGGLNNTSIPSPLASPDSTTTYTVAASYFGCEVVTDEVKVTVRSLPEADAGEDVSITRQEQVQLNATGGLLYEWTPPIALNNTAIPNPWASPDASITYTVVVTNIYECQASDTVRVTVVDMDLFIPAAFTPDQSGSNDVFFVRGEELIDFEFAIFNRLGARIFFTRDFFKGWDGTDQLSGKPMPNGAYVYHVTGTTTNGETIVMRGMVNLIR